jgi:hypothetical protein
VGTRYKHVLILHCKIIHTSCIHHIQRANTTVQATAAAERTKAAAELGLAGAVATVVVVVADLTPAG